jgi:hypothetical protein
LFPTHVEPGSERLCAVLFKDHYVDVRLHARSQRTGSFPLLSAQAPSNQGTRLPSLRTVLIAGRSEHGFSLSWVHPRYGMKLTRPDGAAQRKTPTAGFRVAVEKSRHRVAQHDRNPCVGVRFRCHFAFRHAARPCSERGNYSAVF